MTAQPARAFTAGQIMTVLVGSVDRVFCPWGELLDTLGWLLQDAPMAAEVDDAIISCRSAVQDQHPDLVAYTAPPAGASDAHVLAWLAGIERRHGREFALVPVVDATTPPAEAAEHDDEEVDP